MGKEKEMVLRAIRDTEMAMCLFNLSPIEINTLINPILTMATIIQIDDAELLQAIKNGQREAEIAQRN